MQMLTSLVSIATVLVSGWMVLMYFLLRHPGYMWRAACAAAVCLGAATVLGGRPPARLRIPVAVWGAALSALGVWALCAPGDDGWVVVAAAIFVVEGALAMASGVRSLA
jgi:hypothetical protein